MKNQNKNKFTGLAILIFLVFVLYLFNKNDPTNLNQDSTDQANKTNTTYDVTKKTSSNKNSNNHAANSLHKIEFLQALMPHLLTQFPIQKH